jgi:phthalate 4,5-dioxygenase
MLNSSDNELLTEVGPGTPMGNLIRQYWLPMLTSADLETPDSKPFRVRLLGENLIAFRDSRGTPGLLNEFCPHRGASLYWSRNEEAGLRCVYHGWKFDVAGACVDMPNEPAASNFRDKVRTRAYPCVERNGIVWTYMGPRETPPPLPSFEWNMLPANHSVVWRHLQVSNWMQGLEGNIDSSHLSFLHNRLSEDGSANFAGQNDRGLFLRDKSPLMEVVDTEYGTMYGAGRLEAPGRRYWRVTNFLMPIYGMFAPITATDCPMQWWVPIDDDHVMKWEVRWNPSRPMTQEERDAQWLRDPGGDIEPTSDPLTHHRPAASPANDYFFDQDAQLNNRMSGLPSVNIQDKAMLETMAFTRPGGHVVDRTVEHLGTADAMIIRTRRRLLEAARALRDHGTVPPGVDEPDIYAVRSATVILDDGAPWIEVARAGMAAFTDQPVLSDEANLRGGRRFVAD